MGEVTLTDVRKNYGALEVLHGIDLSISDGEFVVLVGPSGCGKSTLLRMIAGLETTTSGEITVGGRLVNKLPPKDRDIAMVFQTYALYPHMTVADNMGFSLRLRSISKAEIAEKVARAADILDLTPLLQRKPRQLSGGQRQRVAMGRAIVRNPSAFLFDEPLSNLDAKLRVQMRAEIKSLHQRLGTTIVYVTHDQVEAMTMADRIVVMNGGRVEQVGSPLDLYDHPANMFVAQFIGSPAMNVFHGRVSEDQDAVLELEGGGILPLGKRATGAEPGQRISLGVRPENVRLAEEVGTTSVQAKVMVVEPTGAETLVNAVIGQSPVVASVKERLRFNPGEEVPLGFDFGEVHLFDGESGDRID
ncbi:MAG: sn-glycerol-3-phosphate ABC transporter ATP-binding protein UgpC [Stappiaceae bacterium]